MSATYDVLIVGSGPAGVHAADHLIEKGISVALVDIGYLDETYQNKIPDLPFSEIRKSDPNQSHYFLGKDHAGVFVNQARAGAHLTPPRQHMVQDMDEIFPVASEDFAALLATSRGGLGTSWGANCFSFSDVELEKVGIHSSEITPYYAQVATEIGVSADPSSDTAPLITRFEPLQPPLELDSNTSSILKRYTSYRDRFVQKGFWLGPSPLASLTRPLRDRRPNSYHDMDFWSDHGRAVYRPSFTIEKLTKKPGFHYLTRRIAQSFRSTDEGVELSVTKMDSGTIECLKARRMILAAGAINTCRIVATSLDAYNHAFPLLCNPNQWVAALNLRMLGKPASDRRHSLSQLTAVMKREDQPDVNADNVIGHFYSYRSLLLFKLLKDLPIPPVLGIPLLRLLMTAFTLVNVHFSDSPSESQNIRLVRPPTGKPELSIQYARNPDRTARDRKELKRLLSFLFKLRIFPLRVNTPKSGASIHYAGTVPISSESHPYYCDLESRLWSSPHVFIGDSSSWRFLPAKGLTFTIMANARRVADRVGRDLS